MLKDAVKQGAGWIAAGLHATVGRASVGRTSLGRRAPRSVGVLIYHRVAELVAGVPDDRVLNVPPAAFEQQLTGLRARGCTFVPLREVLAAHATGRFDALPERAVVVTFDDIYANVVDNAVPVLRRLEIPATMFVSTAFVDRTAPFPFDAWAQAHRAVLPPSAYRPVTRAHLERLHADPRFEIGAHTHTHATFIDRPDAFEADLAENLAWLDRRLGIAAPTFAFPYGRTAFGFAGSALTERAKQLGVACALTTDCTLVTAASDPFDWGRFNAYAWDTPATLDAKLSGWYGWAPRLMERLAR
ncbi:MAG: polysaccharide deacetylase family protein [Bacteroidota bacterium]